MHLPGESAQQPLVPRGAGGRRRRRPPASSRLRTALGTVATAAAAVVACAVVLAGCGTITTIPTNSGTSVDPSTLEFPAEAAASERPLIEAADGFLAALQAEAWPTAYLQLDAASRDAESAEEYATRWQKSAVRLEGYELRGALTVPGVPDRGVVRAELRVRNQKSDEIWLEYLWFDREADQWRVASNSWK